VSELVAVEEPEDAAHEEQDHLIEGPWNGERSEHAAPAKRPRDAAVANNKRYRSKRPGYEVARASHAVSLGGELQPEDVVRAGSLATGPPGNDPNASLIGAKARSMISPMKHLLAVISVAAVALVAAHLSAAGPKASGVESVYDGDTLTLTSSQRIRLLQIDTPELGSGECYSRAARSELLSLAPLGSSVGLEPDLRLDQRDRYGRLLRYLWHKGKNVNVELVRRGAATPYFYNGDRGKYADTLMAAAKLAKANRRGLWKACPGTKLNPYGPVTTTRSGPPTSKPSPSGKCDPSYRGVCIPPYPPDLDCDDVPSGFSVVGSDPHGFDGDRDGVGCES
jgi:endonuclease YncB( thermonuclease family)